MTTTRQQVMQLVLHHRTRIWAYCMARCRSPQRAEDLFQQTCLVICEKWPQFRPGSNFLAWAMTIARYEHLASTDPKRHREYENEAAILAAAWADQPDESAQDAARRDALRYCLQRLGSRARRAFQLRYAEEQSNARLAEQLSISQQALYALLSRARRLLRECIDRRLQHESAR